MISILKQKYIFIISIFLFIIFFILNDVLSTKIETLTKNEYLSLSKNLKNQVQEAINNKTISTLNIAIALSENSDYKDLLSNKTNLRINLKKVAKEIKKHSDFKNVWIHIIDKNGISKYRSWTEKRGDNVSIIREELPSILKNPKILSLLPVVERLGIGIEMR